VSPRVLFFALGLALLLGLVLKADIQIPSIVLAGVGALGVLALLLWGLARPDIPLYVLAAYLPFSRLLPGGFGGAMTALNLTNLLFVTVLIAWLFDSVSRGRPFFEFHALHIPVALLAACGCLSYLLMALGPDAPLGYASHQLDELKRWLDPFLVYFLFFHGVRRGGVWRNVVGILMVVVVVVAALAVYDYMDVAGASLDRSRVGGVIGQPNYLGAFFVYYMFLFTGHWLENLRRRGAWLFLVPFALCFRGIMVTFSRGAYLAFAQGLLGLAFFKKRPLALAAAAALALVAFNPWLLPDGIRYRLDTTFETRSEPLGEYGGVALEEDLDASSAGRLVIWRGALEMIKAHPFLGVGFGRFVDTIVDYAELDRPRDAHNAYLITAAELGLPGLLLLLVNLTLLFWIANKVYRRHPDRFVHATALGFLGGLSALLMANMFGSRLNSTEVASYVWILAALMARAEVELRRRDPDHSPQTE
jgi:O-antigen ligase